MWQQFWKWNEALQSLKFDRRVKTETGTDMCALGMAELVDEAELWRRMYEKQWEVNARLQKRIEELEGRNNV